MAIAVVNTATGSDYSSATSSSLITGNFDATSGNLIVIAFRYYDPSDDKFPGTVYDSGFNFYSSVGTVRTPGNNELHLFACQNVTGFTAGNVTVTMNAGVQFWGVCCTQYSGVATSSALDSGAVSSGSSSSTTVTSGGFSTDTANEVLVAVGEVAATGGTWTPDTGYALEVQDASNVLVMTDKIVSSIQSSISVTLTSSDGAAKGIVVGGFRAASGGGGGNPWYAYAQQHHPRIHRTFERRGSLWTPRYTSVLQKAA